MAVGQTHTQGPGACRRLTRARARRRLAGVLVGASVLAATAVLQTLASAPALGATGHGFLSSIGEAPLGEALREPGAIAVDHVTGDVFVADPGAGVVDVFSSSGAFLTQFGGGELQATSIAVAEASELVYIAEPYENAVFVYKATGTEGYTLLSQWSGASVPGEEFGEVSGVAVDNSTSASAGEVYVVDGENSELGEGAVYAFQPRQAGPEEAEEGTLLRVLSKGKMEEPNGIAVSNSSGAVFVADSESGEVLEFSPTGVLEGRLTGAGSPQGSFSGPEEEAGNVSAVAVDDADGDLLVAEGERHVVSEFDAAGEWVGWITSSPNGSLGEPRGVAVGASGDVYVADAATHLIDLYGPAVVVPSVATKPASKLARTTVTLNGTIDGEGGAAAYRFEWGTSETLGSSTPTTASGGGEEKASVSLAGLHAGTTYYFRIVGEEANGANVGAIRQFTTPTAVEGLSTGPATEVTPHSATLTGTLSPDGLDAHYEFEYGLTSAYGHASPEPPADAGEASEAVAVKTALNGLAANTTYHYRLLASNSLGTTDGKDATFTTSGPPRIATEAATGVGHETATLNAKVYPGKLAAAYRFEYGETKAYGNEAPLGGGSIPAGEAPVPIAASLTALKLGVTYHFRVVAHNEAGTTVGPDETFTTVAPAPIDAEYITEVTSSTATLHVEIDPLGHDTTYYFEYGTESCRSDPAGCTSLPAPPGIDIGAGEADVPGSQRLEGLLPATTYHYRVLAHNELGTSEGAERTLTTQPTTMPLTLPDNRAWEMVTPPDKQAPLEALPRESGLILASEDGDVFTYITDGALGEEVQGNRSPEWQQVLARRSPSGWSSQDIATPSTRAKGIVTGAAPEYQAFTPDLETALVVPPTATSEFAEPPLAPGVVQATMYLRDDAAGTYLPLVTEANVAAGTVFGNQLRFLDGTPDLSHVVMSSSVALLGASSAPGLYEWAAGTLQPVSVLPSGVPARGELELGYANTQANAISSDGTRVIWTKAESARAGHLYMRDTVDDTTIQLDAAQGVAEPSGVGTAEFQTASADGSKVFFTDSKQLTPDATAEPLAGKPDLYECEIREQAGKPECALRDLTVDANPGESANIQGLVLGVSADGSTLYLIAEGVLAANENGNGETATPGKPNLYELHDTGEGWATTFIAQLSSEDSPEWEGARVANSGFLTARVSPSGRYLAFMSAASLTGYDNHDQNSGQPDEEVYLYDSQTAGLRCVSCNPSAGRPVGVLDTESSGEGIGLLVDRRKVWLGHWLAGSIPGWTPVSLTNALIQPRYLADDGRLFFDSPDDLVPQATNHKEDVYEYEPSGVGRCESASGGCVSLLSSGDSTRESAFLEATPNGSDVFLLTQAQLLPQDTDTAFDIYDARECAQASPCLTPPGAPPPRCEATAACRPALPSEPASIPASGTATFSGPGNQAQAPASPKSKLEVKGVKKSAQPTARAQRLAAALKRCKKRYSHARRRRIACEAHARKLYGPRPNRKKRHTAAHRPALGARARARSTR